MPVSHVVLTLPCAVLLAGCAAGAGEAPPASAAPPARSAVVAFAVPEVLHDPAEDSAAVVATVERYHAALVAGDSAAALSLLASDAVVLESGGMETRAQYREHHLPADIEFARAVARERGPIHVTVRGDAAWAASTSTVTGEIRGREIDSRGAELMVLTRTAVGWRISAIHWSSRSAPASG